MISGRGYVGPSGQAAAVGGAAQSTKAQRIDWFWKPLHHRYVQLSSSNLALPICSWIEVIMMLGLWANMIITRCKHTSLYYVLYMLHCWRQQWNCFYIITLHESSMASGVSGPLANGTVYMKLDIVLGYNILAFLEGVYCLSFSLLHWPLTAMVAILKFGYGYTCKVS